MEVIPSTQDSLDGLLSTIVGPDEAAVELFHLHQCVYIEARLCPVPQGYFAGVRGIQDQPALEINAVCEIE